MKNKLIDALGFLGAVNVFVVPIVFAFGQDPLFPLPGLYFIEIALVGLVAAYSIFRRTWPLVPWLASGILLAFVVLGAWTIGFFLIPAVFAFSVAGYLSDGKPAGTLVRFAGSGILAALVQAFVMVMLINVA